MRCHNRTMLNSGISALIIISTLILLLHLKSLLYREEGLDAWSSQFGWAARSTGGSRAAPVRLLRKPKPILNRPYYVHPTKREDTSLAVTIVISVTTGTKMEAYATALNSVQCYAALHGYALSVEYDDKFDECAVHTDKFFRRHCHIHRLMLTEIYEGDWVLFIDSDVGVVNPDRLVEEYIEEGYEIYLFDRFYNWEYAAQYMVKNNERGRDWVRQFAMYEFKLPDSFHGTDNGALHPLMMHYLVPEAADPKRRSRLVDVCLSIWNNSSSYADLFSMQACTRMVIGERVHFPEQRVKIYQKGDGWAHDSYILHSHWATDDFMLHGLKEKLLKPYPTDKLKQQHCRRSLLNDLDNHACDFVFPVLNKLDVDKCKSGTERWLMEGRLQIDNETRRRLLDRKALRILRKQMESVVRIKELLNV